MLLLTWMDLLQGLPVLSPPGRDSKGLLNASGLSTCSCLAWSWYLDMETLPKVLLSSWEDHFKYCQAASAELGLPVPALGPQASV